MAGVQHVLPVHITHARRANRAVKRNATDRQCGAGGDHGSDIGIDFRIERQGVDDHLHFIEEALRKQRTDGAVDQATGECFELAGTAFALEEAARDFPGGVRLFEVVHCQGEKVLTGFRFCFGNNGCQHHGTVHVQQHGTAGLACNFTGFHADRVLAPMEGLGHFVEHAHVCSCWNVWPALDTKPAWTRVKATLNGPEHTSEHDAIPTGLERNPLGMTQLRSA